MEVMEEEVDVGIHLQELAGDAAAVQQEQDDEYLHPPREGEVQREDRQCGQNACRFAMSGVIAVASAGGIVAFSTTIHNNIFLALSIGGLIVCILLFLVSMYYCIFCNRADDNPKAVRPVRAPHVEAPAEPDRGRVRFVPHESSDEEPLPGE